MTQDNTTARGLSADDLRYDAEAMEFPLISAEAACACYDAKGWNLLSDPQSGTVNLFLHQQRALALSRPVHGLEWDETRPDALMFRGRKIGQVWLFDPNCDKWFWRLGLGETLDCIGRQSAKDALMASAKEWLQPLPAPAQPVTEGETDGDVIPDEPAPGQTT